VDAGKLKLGRADALKLARQTSQIIVAKGRKIVTFDMKRDPPHVETLLKHMLGPTGNLRAPTIKKGRTVLVGFHEEMYQGALG